MSTYAVFERSRAREAWVYVRTLDAASPYDAVIRAKWLESERLSHEECEALIRRFNGEPGVAMGYRVETANGKVWEV